MNGRIAGIYFCPQLLRLLIGLHASLSLTGLRFNKLPCAVLYKLYLRLLPGLGEKEKGGSSTL
jgi:hypothetical protein